MRECENCKITLDDGVRFCPNCGERVGDGGPSDQEKRVRLGALLTSANLHRVKQEWDEAITDAMEALRVAPGNPEVASLLAGIYEQRGDLNEAATWYRIALDFDPGSTADRARLQRVSRQMSEAVSAGASVRQASGLKRDWAPIAIAVIVVLLVTTLVLAFRGPRREQVAPPITGPRSTSTAERAPAITPGGSSTRVSPPAATPISGSAAPSSAVRTAAELAIRTAVGQPRAVQAAGAKIDDVVADPRGGVVVVTFSAPATGNLTREIVLSVSGAIARAAFEQNAEVQTVTVRCVVGGGSAGAQIAFVGDAARSTLLALASDAPPQQLQSVFANTWWNPQLGNRP